MYLITHPRLPIVVFSAILMVFQTGCGYKENSGSDVTYATGAKQIATDDANAILIEIHLRFLDNIERFAGAEFRVAAQLPIGLSQSKDSKQFILNENGEGRHIVRLIVDNTQSLENLRGQTISFGLTTIDYYVNVTCALK